MRPNIHKLLSEFVLKLRAQHYAPTSIKTYKNALTRFLTTFQKDDIEQLTTQQIQSFIHQLQTTHHISAVYQKQILASITKFYLLLYNKKIDLSAIYSKRKAKVLPKYLSVTEVKKLLQHCTKQKHECILKILYGCGLRVSEVIALTTADIDSSAMHLIVRARDGKIDRLLPLPTALLEDIRKYCLEYDPKQYLFEGQNGGKYSVKSIQLFIKKYARDAKIKKHLTPHMLRHSYAIHQLEKGVSISYLQKMLGHHSIKTTEVYRHLTEASKSSSSSPLDYL